MKLVLAAEAVAAGYRLESYEIAVSTNDLAAEFAKSGDKGRLWVAAGEQTGGRGRRGRLWQSPKGNLYATLLLCEDLTAEQTAMLGFVAGLALYEALAAVFPARAEEIKLKWPNDVLAGGAKCAGILPEFISLPRGGAGFKARPQAAAALSAACGESSAGQTGAASLVGIGVNIAAAPKMLSAPAVGRREESGEGGAPFYHAAALRDWAAADGAETLRLRLFQALSGRWAVNYALWDKGRGMAAIREKWLRGAAHLGEVLYLIRDSRRLEGVFETIDEKGRLALRLKGGGREYISAGDVYFGSAASAAAIG